MTYNLLVVGELDRPRLAAALASFVSVPVDAVDVADADDTENRNWDAAVSCTCERGGGDVTWILDIYLTDAVPVQPAEAQAAAHLAEQLGVVVLYPAAEDLPSAYWLADPSGAATRARLYSDDEDDDIRYVIDAVERPVASLPSVPVAAQPEVIRRHQVPTPVTDELEAGLAGATDAMATGTDLWFAITRLGAWEALTVRMVSGWPPDGWYPVEFFREDLETRDELATALERLPPDIAERCAAALARVDESFRAATVEADKAELAHLFGVDSVDLTLRDWWWQRLPDPAPWSQKP